jgi:RHS repeat-associated protein
MLACLLGGVGVTQDSPNDLKRGATQPVVALGNGYELMLSGADTPSVSAWLRNPGDGQTMELGAHLAYARSGESATMLPDGRVAIIGGIGTDGSPVDAVETFDPATEQFTVTPATTIEPRSYHSATLLSNGQVLIAGGISARGEVTGDAQLWNSQSNTVSSVSGLAIPRQGHSATLSADGSVLIAGGVDAADKPVSTPERYDPQLNQFGPAGESVTAGANSSLVKLVATIPVAGAAAVPVDTMISLRFSAPVDATSVNSQTVTLSNSGGLLSAKAIAAEGGMLVFVDPANPLAPNIKYTVQATGLVAADGSQVQTGSFSFTTASNSRTQNGGGVGTGSIAVPSTAGSPTVWTPTSDWRTGLPPSPWQSLPPLRAAQGVTALSGQVLTIDGNVLANVTLNVGSHFVLSDGSGRFLLPHITAGKATLVIDGTTANRAGASFGIFQVGVLINPKVTNVLSYTIWMPVLDTAHTLIIPSPTTADTVLTNPLTPGLSLHIPKGTIIKDLHRKVVTMLSITPVPLDRPPFPLPAGVTVPIYFTIQPGGATLWTTNGDWAWAQLVYPNTNHRPAGTPYDFWNYSTPDGWYVYGRGKVVGDVVVPDPGVGIWQFSGAMVGDPQPAPHTGPCGGGAGGDPVDCSTGIFRHSESDLRIADVIPINLTRTYLSQDNFSRPFGIGTTDNYEFFLSGDFDPWTFMDLVLPDGERVHYVNISADQSSFQFVVAISTLAPDSSWYGSSITWNQAIPPIGGWNLRLKDGTIYQFPDSFGDNTSAALAAVVAVIDRNGNALTISRDNVGNKTLITSPNGRWIRFQHDSANRVTQINDNLGRTVTYNYDADTGVNCNQQNTAAGLLCSVVDANGGITKYTYDTGNRMLSVVDPRGNPQVSNTYDPASDRVAKQTLADSSSYQFSYTLNSSGAITQASITDPNGFVENKSFDAQGFVVADTYAVGKTYQQQFQFMRDPDTELVTSILDPLNRTTTMIYDAVGNLTAITPLSGTTKAVTTSIAYEPVFNQPTSLTDPLGHVWIFAHDSHGNPISLSDPLLHTTSFGYDFQGQLTSITDPANETVTLNYSYGYLTSVSDPLGNQTTFVHDNAGRPILIIDPSGNQHRSAYDPLDRIVQLIDPAGGITALSYDADGDLRSLTDASGNQTGYSYDSRDRLITRTDPLGKGETYAYDNNNNLTQYTDRRGLVTIYQYDGLNRRTLAGFGQSSPGVYQSKINYTWDGGNRLTKAVDSIAGTLNRTYDGLNRVTNETTPQGSVTYTYDKASRRSTMQVAGQSKVGYVFDNANRLTGISQGTASVGIAYDTVNRRSQLTLPNGIQLAYAYDHDSRITGMTWTLGASPVGNLTYSYDADGGVTSKGGSLALVSLPNATTGNTFNADNEMLGFNGTTLTFDANGNLHSDGTNTYTWDARNHLTTISGPTPASFVYDALGRRASKTINGTKTQFLYDGLNPVQELNGASPPTATANLLTGLTIDEYFTRTDSSGMAAFLTDALRSTMALTNTTGTIGTAYTYEPFGKTTVNGASTNPYQFTGRESDSGGSYYYRARYYDPIFQRFLAQDPINFAGGNWDNPQTFNLYAYAANDPIDKLDFSGLDDNATAPNEPPSPGAVLTITSTFARVVTLVSTAAAATILSAAATGLGIGYFIGTHFPDLQPPPPHPQIEPEPEVPPDLPPIPWKIVKPWKIVNPCMGVSE